MAGFFLPVGIPRSRAGVFFATMALGFDNNKAAVTIFIL